MRCICYKELSSFFFAQTGTLGMTTSVRLSVNPSVSKLSGDLFLNLSCISQKCKYTYLKSILILMFVLRSKYQFVNIITPKKNQKPQKMFSH